MELPSKYAKTCTEYYRNAPQTHKSLFANLPSNDQLLTESLVPEDLQVTKSMCAEMVHPVLAAKYLREPGQVPWLSQRETTASLKVLIKVMLNVWRQRREEVRKLQYTVDRLQHSSMKAKNQLRVYSSIIDIEQKRNSELQLQLKQSVLDISAVRSSCEDLTTTVLSLSSSNDLLKQEIDLRKNEYEALEINTSRTSQDLLSTILEVRKLENQLSKEQRTVKQLKRENEQLMEGILKLRSFDRESKEEEEKYKTELEQQDEMLADMRKMVANLQQQLSDSVNKNKKLEQLLMKEKIGELCENLNITQSGCNPADVHMISSMVVAKRNAILPEPPYFNWQRFYRVPAYIVWLLFMNLLPATVSLSEYRYPIPKNAVKAAIALPSENKITTTSVTNFLQHHT